MKALRIKLHQTSANYRREETMENKMTYPLPPISTVIGALHAICGYTEYKPMDVSIQGKYASMHKKPYVDYCFLNSTMDDRGILVKMKNEAMLSNAFEKVAEAKKSQGNSFLKGITIQIHNQQLLEEYRELKALGAQIAEWKKNEYKQKLAEYKAEKEKAAAEKKKAEKGSQAYSEAAKHEKEIKEQEKEYKQKVALYEEEHYKKPVAKFRTLTKSLKYYEILDDIELVLHVRADEDVLNDIYENIYNLQALGRSEDFVHVEEAVMVELVQKQENVRSPFSAYLNYYDVINNNISIRAVSGKGISGTRYYLGKEYKKVDGKRIFEKKVPVVYASYFEIGETSNNVWIDQGTDKQYIVNFL